VDWGDSTSADLMSQSTPGTFTIQHTYKTSGLYTVIIKATDKNGGQAFLQLVGQATGAVQNNKKGETTVVKTQVAWWPTLVTIPLLPLSFWLGGRSGAHNLIKRFGGE
jgi:hypothetical protein